MLSPLVLGGSLGRLVHRTCRAVVCVSRGSESCATPSARRSYKLESDPLDDAEAVIWFRLAAAQGHATAQNNLGVMYGSGEGVPQDDAEAVIWYRLAAAQGHATAQYNLGVMYGGGRGVPQDDAEAVIWYRLAAAQGHHPRSLDVWPLPWVP